ncbi:hypothetical protein TH25_14580 [Thalassospira profundimaris]|uniref:Uncharacterized protein n=1 Tax=Thalassospira profundimaris TaxID=502049 RepID=A0A367X3X7_9PROT|nr:hypothetical protein TH25_14580 [Thalassospira profundimaris]
MGRSLFYTFLIAPHGPCRHRDAGFPKVFCAKEKPAGTRVPAGIRGGRQCPCGTPKPVDV